jgi:hypothetical protein
MFSILRRKVAMGCRHFFTNRWARLFGRDAPRLASTAPWRARHFLFWRSRSGTLSYFGEIDYSLEMPEIFRFDCPNCRAEYKLVRAEADPPPDPQIVCRRCAAPLQGREGKFMLKYFLVDRPRTQALAQAKMRVLDKAKH